jgi:hypothetical protein
MTEISETEAVEPWTEDGGDYGSDLGTGARGPNGEEPEHRVQTPRDLDPVESQALVAAAPVPAPPPGGGLSQGNQSDQGNQAGDNGSSGDDERNT